MIVLAISTNQTLWWITLGAGLIVALVVWGLLELLRRTVNDVDGSVSELWAMGKRLAQNTQAGHLLQTTKVRGAELAAELDEHRATGNPPPQAAERSSP